MTNTVGFTQAPLRSASQTSRRSDRDKTKLQVALKVFFQIAEAWKLSTAESLSLLGLEPSSHNTLARWRSGMDANYSADLMIRLSCLIGIFEALHTIFHDPERANGWIRKQNSAALFASRSAIETMLNGGIFSLRDVRDYLRSQVEVSR